jgi:hypothetical protein
MLLTINHIKDVNIIYDYKGKKPATDDILRFKNHTLSFDDELNELTLKINYKPWKRIFLKILLQDIDIAYQYLDNTSNDQISNMILLL